MFLKSIEIQGFKSFPDKVSMSFGRGVTAIVGPNGSGKSNIVDAIRWVLGEQSTKALRGGKMEDVIFGGTLKRRPVAFCEVTLVLDNSDKSLPLDFAEVSVTRRYYRSGESEFYINRKGVRLKDIHELFMDTGFGRDGYSIIGQGRIDEILSVKSADRREIFEEAAGITRFRYKKEESERRLSGCEENLVRIRDIITELENQVGPLKDQAEKAKSYLIFRDELRKLEISLWMDSLDKLKDNLQKAKVDFENADRKLSAVTREQEQLQEEEEALSQLIREKEIETESIRDALAAVQQQEGESTSRIAVLQNTYDINNETVENKIRELSSEGNRGQEVEAQLAAREKAKENLVLQELELKASLDELLCEAAAASQKGTDLSVKIDAIMASLQSARDEEADAQGKLASYTAQKDEIILRKDSINEEIAALTRRMEKEHQRKTQIEKSLEENQDKKQSAQNMLKGYSLRVESRRKKHDDLLNDSQNITRQKNAKSDRLSLLESMEKDYEGFSNAVKRVMQAKERGELRGIDGTVADLIEIDDKYAVAIEIALGGALQNIVTQTEEDGKRAIGFLKSKDYGRATFLPLTAVKDRYSKKISLNGQKGFFGWADDLTKTADKYSRLIASLLGGTAVCDTLDTAISLAKGHNYSFRIVTLDGQIITSSGAMTGGSLNKNTGVLSRAGEIRRIKEELAALNDTAAQKETALKEAKRDLDSALYDIELAEGDLRLAEDALIGLRAEQAEHSGLLQTLAGSVESLEEEKSNRNSRIEEAETLIATHEQALSGVRGRIDALNAERDALHGGKSAAEEEAGRFSLSAAQKRESIAAAKAEIESIDVSIADFHKIIASMNEEKGVKEQAIAQLKEKNIALAIEIEQEQGTLTALSAQIQEKKAQIAAKNDEKLETEGRRQRCQKAAKAKVDEMMNLERERSRLENKKTAAEMEEEQLVQKLWDNYEVARSAARAEQIPLESISKTNRRIGELKGQMKKLGDVSISSIEEYEKVSARYEDLTTQKNDLDKSRAELEKIIVELTENMKNIFAAEFEKINAMFKQTFVEIFGGGSGYLLLEDENDILNCGIEIKVELPGKAMRAISLLSGGEKAFVAIALYFAIIKVRPSPFCILDEIDAALDNVNVVRFSDYMKTLSDLSQFIVITHRRGTMEGADILYGVTMQEKGVTKLLTMNVSDVENKIKLKPN